MRCGAPAPMPGCVPPYCRSSATPQQRDVAFSACPATAAGLHLCDRRLPGSLFTTTFKRKLQMLLMAGVMLLFFPAFLLAIHYEDGPVGKVVLMFLMTSYSGCVGVCVWAACWLTLAKGRLSVPGPVAAGC